MKGLPKGYTLVAPYFIVLTSLRVGITSCWLIPSPKIWRFQLQTKLADALRANKLQNSKNSLPTICTFNPRTGEPRVFSTSTANGRVCEAQNSAHKMAGVQAEYCLYLHQFLKSRRVSSISNGSRKLRHTRKLFEVSKRT